MKPNYEADVFPGDFWKRKTTEKVFVVDSFDALSSAVNLRSVDDGRIMTIDAGVLLNLYVESDPPPGFSVPEPEPAAEMPASDAVSGVVVEADRRHWLTIGRLSIDATPDPDGEQPKAFFVSRNPNAGRPRRSDVARYPNGRIRREAYE